MSLNRRRLISAAVAAGLTGAAHAATGIYIKKLAVERTPVLGLIVPPASRDDPEEGIAMYGNRLRYLIQGLGIERMTPESFEAAFERIPNAARALKAAGADAILIAGTSLTFYKGEAFNQRSRDAVTQASGLPATTMSNGVIEGLKAVGARRVAVATAYNETVNDRLRAYLREHEMEALVVTGLGLEAMTDLAKVTQDDLLKFGERVGKSARGADALLMSCGGFRTLELITPLESRLGVPVISSMPHGLWAGARLVGLSGEAPGFGQLLSRPKANSTLPGAPPNRG